MEKAPLLVLLAGVRVVIEVCDVPLTATRDRFGERLMFIAPTEVVEHRATWNPDMVPFHRNASQYIPEVRAVEVIGTV